MSERVDEGRDESVAIRAAAQDDRSEAYWAEARDCYRHRPSREFNERFSGWRVDPVFVARRREWANETRRALGLRPWPVVPPRDSLGRFVASVDR